MSISAILSSSALNQASNLENTNQQRRTEFQQITQALQSGDLTNARQALNHLIQSAASWGIQTAQRKPSLSAPGSALPLSDQAGARNAYLASQLTSPHSSPVRLAHHHRFHPGGGGALVLTSGFPDSTSGSGFGTGTVNEVLKPVNLTA